MKNECYIVRDILPLYVEDMVSEETAKFVKEHHAECKNCREDYEGMKSMDGLVENKSDNLENINTVSSLKNIKNKINKKIRNRVLCAVAAILVVIVGVNLLFTIAIKNVSPEDISISADVYSLDELVENLVEDDSSQTIEVKIPEFGTIKLVKDAIEKGECVTVISASSEYFIRSIKSEVKDNTLYISACKTTLLNNKSSNYQKQFSYLELQEINRIVYTDSDGTGTVLWSR